MRFSDWSSDVCSSDLLLENRYEFLGDHGQGAIFEKDPGDIEPDRRNEKPIVHPGRHARSGGKLVDNRYAGTMANERCRNIEGLCRDDFANRDVLPIELGLEQFADRKSTRLNSSH